MVRVSYILESIFAQAAYDLERSSRGKRVKDSLALTILRNQGSKASRVLKDLLTDDKLRSITEYLEHKLSSANISAGGAAAFLHDYREYLLLKHTAEVEINTVDVLIDILEDSTTLLYEAFVIYGIAEKEYYESSEYSHSTVFSNVGLG